MRHGSDRLVLCYHAVSDGWPEVVAVTPKQLAEQLQELKDRGYRGVTFSQITRDDVRGKALAVTFDDGYRSVATLARPILDRLGMPATVFLPTDYIGRRLISWSRVGRWVGTEHEHELEPMSWEDARSLAEAGWEVGSHSRSHAHLTELSDAELDDELAHSRLTCERSLGTPCHSLAFPFGEHDRRVLAAAERAGYSAAATLLAGTNPPSRLRWPRVAVTRLDGTRAFRLRTSPVVRRSPALTLLGRAPRRIRAIRPLDRRLRQHAGQQPA